MFLHMLREAGEHSAEDLLPQIEIPALVVAGERDSFTPPALSEAMAEAMPHGEYVLVPGGTHILPLEDRERVNAAIAAFLSHVPMG
jgi:pimeloyl-ACP methyl ester carboxylesterase